MQNPRRACVGRKPARPFSSRRGRRRTCGRTHRRCSTRSGTWNRRRPQTQRRNPLLHYLERGVRKRRSPNRLFDVSFYLAQNPDVAAAGGEPLAHYLAVGASKGSNPHPLFDTVFYLERNPDVAAAGMNPLEHYLTFGGSEGRDPHPLFHTAFYLNQNPDVRAAKVESTRSLSDGGRP